MKVLLASDGSSMAINAARFLGELEFDSKLQLTVLTVSLLPELSIRGNIQNPEWDQREREFVASHHAELEGWLAGRCERGFSKLRQTGNAAQAILQVSKRIVADLIVVGAVGHSVVSRMLLGSVSDNVATHADCSVLVVRPRGEATSAKVPARKISLAYDGSPAAHEAVHEIMSMRWDPGTEMNVVSVAPTYDYLMGDALTPAVLTDAEMEFKRMQDKAEYQAKQIATTLPHTRTQVVSAQHAGEAIVSVVDQNQSDLVVLGETGHSRLHDWFLGSTTKYVLRHAPCSVWISRHHRTAAGE
ncbi:universal stress protein UspE [Novipirellula galeiformis]|uniref:Universal stress protein UspE n=1 Tax=Novipirellula galeiformis TaxID=2528004 RepID=A0A5C6CAH9_9BACT|nr:universal stress protein [Novipirellula galeiformis]TWU20957.1 universal stress protein UspE [Novipirellula galeiformis]